MLLSLLFGSGSGVLQYATTITTTKKRTYFFSSGSFSLNFGFSMASNGSIASTIPNNLKRLIFLLLLLTIVWLPYSMHRWLTLPYSKALWESYALYSGAAVVTLIGLANVGLLLAFRLPVVRLALLKGIAGLLFLLLFFPIVMGGMNAYQGSHAWVDAIALGVLYINLQWLYKVYQSLLESYENDNS